MTHFIFSIFKFTQLQVSFIVCFFVYYMEVEMRYERILQGVDMSIMLKVLNLRIDREPENDLAFLQQSIQEHGLLFPILVDHTDTVVDGVRRVEACKRLGIEDIPAIRVNGMIQ